MNRCAHCNTSLPEDPRFCPECGKPVDAPESRPAAPAGLDKGLLTIGGLETIGGEETRRPGSGAALPTLEPGERFADRYAIQECVGAGGMGVVYRAKDTLTDKTVALKLIRSERLGGPHEVKRLIEEGVTARDIRHKNVVAVYDVGEVDGQPYLSMEYLDGRSLRSWHRALKQRGEDVPFAVAARIVAEVLNGLQAAHEAGVTHRDLKPENIMLVGEPTASAAPLKIVDFGIARAAGTGSDTGTGTGVGTPHYMAPEQITQADLAGPTADLYSLSVIFYELLVDVLPQGHWQAPSGGRSDVPRGVDELIAAGLSNRPSSRPASTKAYRDALARAVRGGAGGRDSKRVFQPMSPAWKKWGGIAAAAVLVLAVLSAIVDEFSESDGGGGGGAVGPGSRQSTTAVSDLSGMWHDGYGGMYEVYVDPDGYFSGSGMSADGMALDIEGQISGRNLSYGIGAFGQVLGRGSGSWDGNLHLSYQTNGIDGSVLRGQFRVDPSAY